MPVKPPVHRQAGLPIRAEAVQRFDAARGSASARGYDRAWQRVRLLVLAQEPLCRFCALLGLLVAAEVVDHILSVRERPDLRLDQGNLRALCKACHDSHTALQTGRLVAATGTGPGRQ